jgi:hypothetical protein
VTMNGNQRDEFGVEVSPASSVTIDDLAFKSSYVYNAGTLTLINSTITGNTALQVPEAGFAGILDGGGAFNNGGKFTLINSTVSGNTANTGGGISNAGGTLMMINSTVSDNRAQRSGGGILNGSTGAQMEMIFCTIYGNTSDESGGGIWNGADNSASQLMMRNSLIAGNKAGQGPDVLGKLTSQGYNLIQNTEDTTFAPSQSHGTDLLQVAPTALRIDPLLKDNKGATQTHALLPRSVAIDRIPIIDCHIEGVSTDQRGVRRPQGVTCDVGAYELLV